MSLKVIRLSPHHHCLQDICRFFQPIKKKTNKNTSLALKSSNEKKSKAYQIIQKVFVNSFKIITVPSVNINIIF